MLCVTDGIDGELSCTYSLLLSHWYGKQLNAILDWAPIVRFQGGQHEIVSHSLPQRQQIRPVVDFVKNP